jgi:hypothetical protein
MSSSGSSGIDTFKASSIITVFLSIMVWSKAMVSLALTPVVLIIGYFIYNNYTKKTVDNRSHDGSRSEADSSSTNAASSTGSNDRTHLVEERSGGVGTPAKETEEKKADGDVAVASEPPASKDVTGGGGGGAELRKWKSKPINSREKDKSVAQSPPAADETEASSSTSSNVLKKSLSNFLGDNATPAPAANTPVADVSASNSDDTAAEVIPVMVNTPTPPPAITTATDLSRSRSSTSNTTDGVLIEDSDNELRKYVYLEILDTEDQYVKDLAIMKTLFMDPLLELSKKGKKALLDAAEIELIFSPNLTTMLSINSELLNNLKGLEVLRSLDLSKGSAHEGPSFSEVVSRAFKKIMVTAFFVSSSMYR